MTILVILHIAICVFLVFVILLQPGKGDAGIGFGSSSQSIFGSAGAGNFLTKTTSACAIMFIFTSFLLTRSRILEYSGSVIKGNEPVSSGPAKPNTPPAVPAAPKADAGKAPEPTAPKK